MTSEIQLVQNGANIITFQDPQLAPKDRQNDISQTSSKAISPRVFHEPCLRANSFAALQPKQATSLKY